MNARQWIAQSLKPCTALITGASSGIGYQYLRSFAELGCECIATSIDESGLRKAADDVRRDFGAPVTEIVSDLTLESDRARLFRETEGRQIDVLVNNAGFGVKGEFLSHPPTVYQELVALNALAPTLLCRHYLPPMVTRQFGLVIHVASINAVTPIAYNAVYTATKAYLLYYAYAIAHELRETPVRFQVVLPGTTRTPFHDRQGAVPTAMFMEPDEVVRRSLARIDQLVSISNRADRFLFPFIAALPLWLRVRLGTYLLKQRLKLSQTPAAADI